MTAPSTLDALIDSLGNAALRGEISWQSAERIIELTENSAAHREEERERREWLSYSERVRLLNPEHLEDDDLQRELHLVRAQQLAHPQSDWLRHWEAELITEARQRWESVA